MGLMTVPVFAATNIPTQAWSRDINAGGYIDGAPVGGFGAGTMTWDFAGDFYLGRLNIASGPTTTNNPAFALDANCHFYMYQKVSGQTAVMKMLNAATLGSGEATYASLFPKSWVSYYGSTFALPATVTQFSPIMPQTVMSNALTVASYPEAIYEWDVTNSQAVSVDFAIMLTFNNSFGGTNAAVTTSGTNEGLVLTRNTGNAANQNQGEFTLATQIGTGVTVTYESAASVATLQTAFTTAGLLNNTVGTNTIGGIAFNVNLAPGQSVKIPIVVAWDIPIAKPGTGAMWYREYTEPTARPASTPGPSLLTPSIITPPGRPPWIAGKTAFSPDPIPLGSSKWFSTSFITLSPGAPCGKRGKWVPPLTTPGRTCSAVWKVISMIFMVPPT